jgi:type II secretory pathway component PulM
LITGEPDGEQVRVWLENTDFAKVASWLHTLSQQGVKAQEVHFEQNNKGLSVRLVFGR